MREFIVATLVAIVTGLLSFVASVAYTSHQLRPAHNVEIIPLRASQRAVCRIQYSALTDEIQKVSEQLSAAAAAKTPTAAPSKSPSNANGGSVAKELEETRNALVRLFASLSADAVAYQGFETGDGTWVPVDRAFFDSNDPSAKTLTNFLKSKGLFKCDDDNFGTIIRFPAVIRMNRLETYTLWRTCKLQIDSLPQLKVRLSKEDDTPSPLRDDTVQILKETTKVFLTYDAALAGDTASKDLIAYKKRIQDAESKSDRYWVGVQCKTFAPNSGMEDANADSWRRFTANSIDEDYTVHF